MQVKKQWTKQLLKVKLLRVKTFHFFGGAGIYTLNSSLAKDTVISIFDKYSGGQPVAKSYGTWNGVKIV